MPALHLQIFGSVQGVGFRFSLAAEAEQLGLRGWVRNRRDGTVEAVVHGNATACDALQRWAHRGPPAARVDRVQVRAATEYEVTLSADGFASLPTA